MPIAGGGGGGGEDDSHILTMRVRVAVQRTVFETFCQELGIKNGHFWSERRCQVWASLK